MMNNGRTNPVDDHSRTIIHIDMDCYYAQVEMIKNPSLCKVPLGIQQKNYVITSNYLAREYGIQKCMLISDAMKVCPNLVLVNGEDLYDYRKISSEVTAYIQEYSILVERLGLDENYVDVSNLVKERLLTYNTNNIIKVEGHIFSRTSESCQCGCENRLKIGSIIAQEIRNGIKNNFKLTSCAGVGHNKLLAKLVGSVNKPNQQTTIFPNGAMELMLSLKDVASIPGIGSTTAKSLEGLNIRSVEDLQNFSFEKLKLILNVQKAKWILDLSYGRDISQVKISGKPQTIGLEDSCKLSIEAEIKDKFRELLTRLLILVSEDGRVPTTIKVTVRKFDNINKVSHRETRQCNISPNLFTTDKSANTILLSEHSENKILNVIMHLFSKLVDISQSYRITLVGLAFTKFQECVSGRNSIASYFVKDVAVQLLTSIESTRSIQKPSQNLPATSYDFNIDRSESETEPSPKKSKIGKLTTQSSYSDSEYSSPSKLRVADLRLNSRDSDQPENNQCIDANDLNIDTLQGISCPPNADEDVFQQLPVDLQQELWNEWRHNRSQSDTSNKPTKKQKTNTILNYFIKN